MLPALRLAQDRARLALARRHPGGRGRSRRDARLCALDRVVLRPVPPDSGRRAPRRGVHERFVRASSARSRSWRRSRAASAARPARRAQTARSLFARSSVSAAAAGRRSSPSTTTTACTSRPTTCRRSSRSSVAPDDRPSRRDHRARRLRGDRRLPALAKARAMTPEAVTDELITSELRGRGGAFFPTGRKWSFVPSKEQLPKPHYLVVNADESEPGSFKDNEILSRVPHRFIEGCLITAHAIDCDERLRLHPRRVLRAVRDPRRRTRGAEGPARAARGRDDRRSTAARARTSAARRRRCSSRSRESAASRARSRRSLRSRASTRRRRSSTTSRRSRPCRR